MSEPAVNWLETDLPSLLLHQQEVIEEREERLHEAEMRHCRFNKGVACMQWIVSRAASPGVTLDPMIVLRMLDEIVLYANVGTKPGWLARAHKRRQGS